MLESMLGISPCDFIWIRVFADVIKARVLRSSWIKMGPKCSGGYPIRDRNGYTEERSRQKGHVKTEAEMK